jgi:hypothetical protein
MCDAKGDEEALARDAKTIVWTWQVRLTIQHFMTKPKTQQSQVFGAHEAVPVWLARDRYEARVEGPPVWRDHCAIFRFFDLYDAIEFAKWWQLPIEPSVHSLMIRNVDFSFGMTT